MQILDYGTWQSTMAAIIGLVRVRALVKILPVRPDVNCIEPQHTISPRPEKISLLAYVKIPSGEFYAALHKRIENLSLLRQPQPQQLLLDKKRRGKCKNTQTQIASDILVIKHHNTYCTQRPVICRPK